MIGLDQNGDMGYAWMKSVVAKLKEEMGWTNVETLHTFKIRQVSLVLLCEYTKGRLGHPARTRRCRHLYCM
jgi:hypothetical protein